MAPTEAARAPAMRPLLLFVALLFVVWKVLVALGRRSRSRGAGADHFSRFSARRRDRGRRVGGADAREAEALVECRRCGAWVPAGRALVAGDGALFCSDDCRRLGVGAAPAAE